MASWFQAGFIMHGNGYPRLDEADHFHRLIGRNGIGASNRNKKDIHLPYSLQLIRVQQMTKVAQVTYHQIFGLKYKYRVFASQLASFWS
jgi:hypothetical protein